MTVLAGSSPCQIDVYFKMSAAGADPVIQTDSNLVTTVPANATAVEWRFGGGGAGDDSLIFAEESKLTIESVTLFDSNRHVVTSVYFDTGSNSGPLNFVLPFKSGPIPGGTFKYKMGYSTDFNGYDSFDWDPSLDIESRPGGPVKGHR